MLFYIGILWGMLFSIQMNCSAAAYKQLPGQGKDGIRRISSESNIEHEQKRVSENNPSINVSRVKQDKGDKKSCCLKKDRETTGLILRGAGTLVALALCVIIPYYGGKILSSVNNALIPRADAIISIAENQIVPRADTIIAIAEHQIVPIEQGLVVLADQIQADSLDIDQSLQNIKEELSNCTNAVTVKERLELLRMQQAKKKQEELIILHAIRAALAPKIAHVAPAHFRPTGFRRSYQMNPMKLGKMARAGRNHHKDHR